MPYKISGTKSETARVMVLKESDWSIESNTVISGSGAYEVDGLETGAKTTLALTEEGEFIGFGGITPIESGEAVVPKSLWSWGGNSVGELGLGDLTDRSSPVQVGALVDWDAVSLSVTNTSGYDHTIAIKTDGTLWAWGYNYHGQLGIGTAGAGTYESSPVQVGLDTDWSAGTSSRYTSFAVKTDGTLWAWGYNYNRELGLGRPDRVPRSSPVQVGSDIDWSDVSAGRNHTVVIKTNGKIYSWGSNDQGQLGNGTTVSGYSPEQAGTDTDWSSVDAGRTYTAAIKTDGTLWTWGYNDYGKLGLGDQTSRSTPTKVGLLDDWSSVDVGNDHTAAIKTDGTLWTWGDNDIGQLGLGHNSPDEYSSPVQVGALTDWSQTNVGYKFSAAVKTDGTLWTWGSNYSGKLGSGYPASSNSPVQVGSDTDWSEAVCGSAFTMGLKIA